MLLAQVGAVVLMFYVGLKREKGNITIFALDEGQGFSEHTAPFDAIVQAVEGGAGKPIPLKAGDFVLLPAVSRMLLRRSYASKRS